MKFIFAPKLLMVVLFFSLLLGNLHPMIAADNQPASDYSWLPQSLPAHPRLMLTEPVKDRLRELVASDPWAMRFFECIEKSAAMVSQLPPTKRILYGDKRKRMLEVSRTVLHHIVIMGMANAIKPDPALKQRMIDEMYSVATFEDWHPVHFLDTSEMTLAMALGYDWLYNELSDEQRTTIRQAIVRLGLEAAMTHDGGLKWTNNWNQVRHGSMCAGALAVYEDQPQLARVILQQAKDNYQRALHVYEGDGVYPEGPMYWSYGTSFSWIMSACLTSALGDDWGILESPGFARSFEYVQQVTAPGGQLFNFADCYVGPMDMPMHMWVGNLHNRPDYITASMQSLERYIAKPSTKGSRLAPLALLWYKPVNQATDPHPNTCYVGRGLEVQIAMLREKWHDRNAAFVGIKGGNIRVNHGHMDIGSVIIEADGVRWIEDMGMEKEIYDRNDSWSTDQNSLRWQFLRASNLGHSTLNFANQWQQVEGMNPILGSNRTDAMQCAVLDMSTAYQGQARSVQRGIALLADRQIMVQDDYAGVEPTNNLIWQVMTRATITLDDTARIATLKRNGKTLRVSIVSPETATFSVRDATPPTELEEQNKDYHRLTIDLPAPVSDGQLRVCFTPQSAGKNELPNLGSLKSWLDK